MPEAGQILDAVILEEGTYVPALQAATTNPTLGAGAVQSGWWKRIGNLIMGEAFVRFGTSGINVGSGTYYITLPFPADTNFELASGSAGLGSAIAVGVERDNSATSASVNVGCTLDATADRVWMRSTEDGTTVNETAPIIIAVSDAFQISFRYQADPNSL